MNNLKIAIDSGPLESGDSVRGIGTYTRELLRALKMEGIDISKEDLAKYDIVHFTRFNPFFVSIPFSKPKNTRFVLTIYDLIPLLYPEHYPPGIRGLVKWQINKFLIKKNVDAIITISETSRKDICRFLEMDPEKVFVTYLAPSPVFRKLKIEAEHNLPDRFALYVGDVNYNKNIPNLIKACEVAKVPLVIIGKQAREVEDMDLNHPELMHLKNLNWKNVLRPGFVSEEDLVKTYNLASVYIQPSLYEGFGLPVLEAMSCETPVVAAKSQCLVEILGEDFDYVDPSDPDSIAKGILHPNKTKKLPRDYSWEKTVRLTMEVYEKILKS